MKKRIIKINEPEIEFIEVTPEIQKKMDKIATLLSDDDDIKGSLDVSTKKGKRSCIKNFESLAKIK